MYIDHIAVPVRDKVAAMNELAGLLGVPPGPVVEPFAVVELGEANLDFMTVADGDFHAQHVALRVSEEQFEEVLARIIDAGIDYFGHPQSMDGSAPGEIYYDNDGRGFYFWDSNGHGMEIKTGRDYLDPESQARFSIAPYTPARERSASDIPNPNGKKEPTS